MKKRYTEEQFIGAIKEHESGVKVDDICRNMGISVGTFYNWRSKYGGLEVNETKQLKELESGNNKLKKLLADKILDNEAMKDVLSKKWGATASADLYSLIETARQIIKGITTISAGF